MKKHKLLVILLSFLLLPYACGKRESYYHFYEIKNSEWSKTDTLFFEIDSTVIERGVPYHISIEITNNAVYPYQNIWFFVQHNLQSDSSLFVDQQVHYMLADKFGKWYGSGFGPLYQLSLPYMENFVFPEKRNYLLKIEHGMRDEPLTGIEKVGLKIELANPT